MDAMIKMLLSRSPDSIRGGVPLHPALLPLSGEDMSYKAQQWALEQNDVFGLDKWVLFILAYRDNHDEPHGCWPSQSRMATDCGVSRRAINYSLKKLEKLGKVHRQRRTSPEGDPDSTYYTFPQVWGVV